MLNPEYMEMETQTDLLTNIKPEVTFIHASLGQRFTNYVVDFFTVAILHIGIRWLVQHFETEGNTSLYDNYFISAFFHSLVLFLYYLIFESVTNGKTLGKYITGTTAIRTDSLSLTSDDVLKRSLSRLVPFEVLSGFTEPWHDRWSKTFVVRIVHEKVIY
jgi:uncharacterized RDD family membrane protein YckC